MIVKYNYFLIYLALSCRGDFALKYDDLKQSIKPESTEYVDDFLKSSCSDILFSVETIEKRVSNGVSSEVSYKELSKGPLKYF